MNTDILEAVAPDVEESFSVRDLNSANWAVGVVIRKNAKKAEIDAAAVELHRRVDEWAEQAKKDMNTDYLEELLREWTFNEIQGEQKRSVKLFGATAGFRRTPDTVEVVDEDQAIEYCTAYHPDLVKEKVTYSIDKKMVKALAEDTGELIPGVEIHQGYDKFYIKGE